MAEEIPKEILQIIDLYKQTFNSDSGKKVLIDLRSRCYGNRSTFDKDANTAAFNEGQRNVILHIENFLNFKSRKE